MSHRIVKCNYCGNQAELVAGDTIYPHRQDLYEKRFWLCRKCDAYVGVHRDSKDYAPLGRLADAELRKLKVQTHAEFDPLWKSGKMRRDEAYRALSEEMGINKNECHIGMFSNDRCELALRCLRAMKEKP